MQSGQRETLAAAPKQLDLAERVANLEYELAQARSERDKALGRVEALEELLDKLLRMLKD